MNERDIKKIRSYIEGRKENNTWANDIYNALEKVKGNIGQESAIIKKAIHPNIVRKIIKGELK